MSLRNVSRHSSVPWTVVSFILASSGISAQAPFLMYDFENGSLADFFNPVGIEAIDLCGDLIPAGEATVDSGELLMTNDAFLGLAIVSLDPDIVASEFPPDSRDYALRLRFNLETVNQLSVYVRGRLGIDRDLERVHSILERGYVAAIFPEALDPAYPEGLLALAEFTGCHEAIDHPEWPGAEGEGYARVAPGFPIISGDWYWLEVATQGNDEGGPVLITVKLWVDGDDPPAIPQIVVTDPDGIAHTPETLDPAADVEVSLGTSFDVAQQPGATCRIDDITITELEGCKDPPLEAVRDLWNTTILAEGLPVASYTEGEEYEVNIALSSPRPAGACAAAGEITITEMVPTGWDISGVTQGGAVDGNVITWSIQASTVPITLTYKVTPPAGGRVAFLGDVSEPGNDLTFVVTGEDTAAGEAVLAPVSDFGSIQHWLILGPFTRQVGGNSPGDVELARDYLTDGVLTELDITPRAGETIEPDYAGAAASTGLAPNSLGRNPDDIPTWIEWRDYDDADDRIDFESVYGEVDEVMAYAATYLDVAEDTIVNFGVSSDDSVQVLLDGVEIHKLSIGRGATGRTYQDTPFSFPSLGGIELSAGRHLLMVKVFEGGGDHNFRVGFLDDTGLEIAGGPPEITVLLEPVIEPVDPKFRRGDSDADGATNITDAIFTLSYLFTGGRTPTCLDAADGDDDGQVAITDPIRVLGFLFIGGPPPPPPGDACGIDPTEDDLGPCVYTPGGVACP
ncbi:MAG TPA: hypothetical protein VMT52_07130 [Planctomycetota bacterium]|nr:hypothetical protein [Planctomycetota bacterium]